MRRWPFYLIVTLMLGLGVLGCGGNSSTGVSLVISPTSVSIITNTTQQFSSAVTGSSNTTVTWTVACASGVTANTCGTIDSNGLYTAPATIPTATVSGTVTAMPTVTITGTSSADTTKTATATLTIVTGVRIAINPTAATVGTGEHFTFIATVNNPGCNTTSNPNCLKVTWSVPTTAGVGAIDANGVYTAPGTAPSPSAVTITATSVTDTTITATATVTVVTAGNPTLTSVTPKVAALGSLFQDIYISGTNFISTNLVYVNGTLIDPTTVADISSSVIRARLPANLLASTPPSGFLVVAVSQQVGTPQTCTDPAQCQVVVSSVRPVIVGPSPDSISQTQNSSSVLSFNVNGGFFGTSANPSVSATYDGHLRVAQISDKPTRQISVSIGGNSNAQDFSKAGLHPVTLVSNGDPTKFAAANIAVQPDVSANPPTQIGADITVGTTPSDVAVNPATGMAVVANTGSNSVSLIDLTAGTPAVITASLCTAAVGSASGSCPASGPKSVAVAHLISPTQRNIALVANSTSNTIAEIDLDTRAVIWVSPTLQDSPVAVGINPVNGRALVAMNTRSYGLLVDLISAPPKILGPVSIATGPNAHIAVEPHLNWALSTPGGIGSIGIVDLNRQNTNNITNFVRTTNVVTVTVQASTTSVPQSPLSVIIGDTVQIQGASDNSFNGFYVVSSVGPGSTQFSFTQTGATLPDLTLFSSGGTVNYAEPVARLALPTTVQGVGINPETQQAILVDPSPNAASNGTISIFSLIDQSVSTLSLTNGSNGAEPGAAAGTFNPLTNTAYVVNPNNSTLSVIDPTAPRRLPAFSSTFPTGQTPVALAVDPASNRLIVVNQGSNSVSVYSLGLANTVQPVAITETNPKTFVATSTLTTAPTPAALTLSVLGKGFTCTGNSTSFAVRLDGVALSTSCAGASGDRALTAIVPPSSLTSAHRFTVDVKDAVSGTVSNASDFTVEQSIDVTACAAAPLPSGVAIDIQQNLAAVTLNGCNQLALINLSNGTGRSVAVGANPLGVAIILRLHAAVVANNGGNSASIVDELGGTVTSSPSTGSSPVGVGANPDTGEAVTADSVGNTVTVINVETGGTSTDPTGQRPLAAAFNYQNHSIAVASSASNSVSIVNPTTTTTSLLFSVNLPTSLLYDPAPDDCAGNAVGCFLANSSTTNVVYVLDPITQQQSQFRIGINPTAIAYNFLTSTLVSTNTASRTVTVADFLDRRIRAVLTLPAPPSNSNLALNGSLQFALDVHPFTNLAVIADTANGRVLLVPIPR